MGEIQLKPEGSISHSLSSFASGLWDEIASVPGNIAQHFRDHTGTAIAESLLPPLLLIDAEVRAHDDKYGPLTTSEQAVTKMVEDAVMHGNASELRDVMVMNSGDPSELNRVMAQAQQDMKQFGLSVDYSVDSQGQGNLRIASANHFVETRSDGSQTFGDIRNGQDVAARNGATVDQYQQSLARDAQQYVQKRFH